MFKIFPLTRTKDNRKVPIAEMKNWKEKASSDPAQIAEWTKLYGHKIKMYGVPTGPENDLLVVDVDIKNGGLETIKNYHVPLTMSQRTPSGGIHYLFKYPKDGNKYGNKVGFAPGLDIRGHSGYIAFYGTDNTLIAEPPEWLKAEALTVTKEAVNPQDVIRVSPEIVKVMVDESCNNILNAPEGEGNNVLNIESYKIGQLVASNSITKEEAMTALLRVSRERGRPDYESTATIESGLSGGTQNPIVSPFGSIEPVLTIPEIEPDEPTRWTPKFFTKYDLTNFSKLRKPPIFKDWSTEDIHITTADGGTGKTTLKLVEAICLALGESFLGFECKEPGRTLFITGEDTAEKLAAMLGAIMKQMKILDDKEKVSTILNAIVVKKDTDLCLIAKNKQGFITVNSEAIAKVAEAIEDIKPKMIVFDPISSFWGSEAALNDMSKAVAKFMGVLVEKSNACVEVINHMGKASSKDKDMSQFAGRGGTGLPSHARVSRVLRPLFDEEYEELTGTVLTDGQTAMMCNVNKFTDGSPLYNKPFVIIREGYLFSRVTLVEQKIKEQRESMTDSERIFTFIKSECNEKRYPTKEIVNGKFSFGTDKISKARIVTALSQLNYTGHMGEKTKTVENPDPEVKERVYVITDMEGREL